MSEIEIKVSKPYKVHVQRGLIDNCGATLKQYKANCSAIIISDETVFGLYGERVSASLEKEGYKVISHTFPAGEKSKTLSTAGQILEFLAQNKISRSDIIIALGGGVVGDMAGFCASIYLRGIDFVQIPTTILACADSSVGGKTAVDLPEGKNLVGAFYQPITVLCDVNTFETLPNEIKKDGLCEIIKYGCILDRSLFNLLSTGAFEDNIEDIIIRCIELKAMVVKEDEFDTGVRRILNFGHTLGHGIESLSNYQISHGNAVAMGMYYLELCDNKEIAEEIKAVLDLYEIPLECDYDLDSLVDKVLSDKKIEAKEIDLILLEEIGEYKVLRIKIEEIKSFLKRGWKS